MSVMIEKRLFFTIILACLAIGLKAQNADSLRAKILQCFNESRFTTTVAVSPTKATTAPLG